MDPSYAPGINGQPAQANTSKPDRSEPWRYVCPKCGNQPTNKASMNEYACQNCGKAYSKDELTDLKRQ